MPPHRQNTLQPPPPPAPRPYNSFEGEDGDSVEEIQDAGAITMEKLAFAWSTYCDVYAGIWKKPGGVYLDVAVKVLRPVNTNTTADAHPESELGRVDRRLGREMYTWRRLKGPRITPLLGYVRTDNFALGGERACLISPRRANGNLSIYLGKHPEADRLKLLIEAAEGLEYLHTFDPQIAHMDLKPENILVNDRAEAEICDFGLSKALVPGHTGYSTGAVATGTIPFTAPEVLMESDNRSTMADVYAFGGIILWALSSKLPFHKVSPGRVVVNVVSGILPKREDHPIRGPQEAVDEVWTLMKRCWDQDPQHRPTASQLLTELKAIRKLLEIQTPP